MRLGTRFLFRESFYLHTTIFLYREKVTLFGRGFRVAGTCGAAWNSLFVLRKLSSSRHDVIILRKKLHCGADRVVGTCGAAWNSLFVLRKLSSSRHDFLIPREVTLIGRGFRVAGTCGAAWNSLLFRESFYLHTTIFLYRERLLLSAEDLGWRYLNLCGSTFPSVGETFPCRVMSHPRFGTVAKLL